jgi:uncharacterized protein YndB with AHSA1/START domain
MAEYRFLQEWIVPAPVEQAYDLIGDQNSYPEWWGDVFLEVEGDAGPPRPGRRARLLTKGFLPYKIRWTAEITEVDPPHGFSFELEGDFEGGGTWRFEPVEGGTKALFDWRPIVRKRLIHNLTPVLRPLFAANHNWSMRRGQEGVVREAHRRRQAIAS